MTTVITEPIREDVSRGINYLWLLREAPNEQHPEAPWRIYAELSIDHHGRAQIGGRPDRCYTAVLGRRKEAKQANGITSRSFGVFGQGELRPVRVLDTVPAARFSPKTLAKIAEDALARIGERRAAGDPAVAAIFDPTL